MHVLIPALAKKLGKRTIRATTTGERHAPRSHKREHNERSAQSRIVLIASFGRVPLGQAENFQEKDAEEHK